MTRQSNKQRRYLRGFRRSALDVRRMIGDEFAFHLDMTVKELEAGGMSRPEAEAEARRRFGRIERYRDDCRRISNRDRKRQRLGETMNDLLQDLRFALRRLAHNPLFTCVALLTLALGIGANTAVFTLVNGIVLQPLPYHAPEELTVLSMAKTDGSESDSFSYRDFLDVQAQTETLADIGFWTWWSMDITDGDEPLSVQSVRVSANMLSVIGIEPAQGRLFRPEEAEEGNDAVAIVSHSLWQGIYGGRALVGSDIELDGRSHTVVGIMPEGFRFPYVLEYGAGFWTPLPMDADGSRSSRWVNAVARRAPDVSGEQVQTEIETIAARLAAAYPASNGGWSMVETPMHNTVVSEGTRSGLWILYGVVAFVLLIACANLANLLLARMESRQHEIAVRAALGAGRGRLLRELLAESILISVVGGLMGIALAAWGMRLFLSLVPANVPRLDEINFDATVLLFALAVTAATAVLFGVLPAAQASRTDLHDPLKRASAPTAPSGSRRFRSALVVAEIAIALVLLVGAGLLVRSFGALLSEEMGFDPQRVLMFQVSPAYDEGDARNGFYRDVLDQVGALAGVEMVGASTAPPLSGVQWSTRYTIDDLPLPALGQESSAEFNIVSPDFFRTLAIPLVEGRFFSNDDTTERGRVVIVNETFARHHWPDGTSIGRSISIGDRASGSDGEQSVAPPSFEIVGIVGDTRKFGADRKPSSEIFIPYNQNAAYFMNFVVRTRGDPMAAIDAVRSRIREIDDSVATEDLSTLGQLLEASVAEPRFNAMLVGSFAALAMVLATLGVYGVVSYSAAERTREIGVRIALGATASDVFRLVLGQGLILTGIGITVGLLASLAASRLLSSLLYGVSTTDPLTFVGVAVVLGAVALMAGYVPARRATRVDPIVALRD